MGALQALKLAVVTNVTPQSLPSKFKQDYIGLMLFPRLHTILAVLFLLSVMSAAQAPKFKSPKPLVDNAFVQKRFGATCSLMAGPQPLTADLDGDGVEDVVIVARCTNPLLDEAQDNFQLIDPYNAFFGYGNPRITSQFASEDPAMRGLVLLVIHGAGPKAWRSPTPKAKFVIINLPFKQVLVRKLIVKKKTVMAIFAEETGGNDTISATFWDGKKYKYQPLGAGFE
jgi:hypothetical protein